MSESKMQEKENMIKYISHLLKSGIYCHGNNLDYIATYLYSNGCRIHMGKKRLKHLQKEEL